MKDNKLQILDIIPGTSVDGPGLRTSIYLAGCNHQCPECHNPHSWDFAGGKAMSVEEILDVVEENGFNVTLTGGDPVYSAANILPLVKILNEKGYKIWLYTGFLFEELLKMESMRPILPMIEVVVDGPFKIALKSLKVPFRGSTNQRLVDVASSLTIGQIVEWTDPADML